MESYFLVGGTTSGIYAMIMSATEPGDTILIARDCHRAVYDAAFLGHLNVVYIEPYFFEGISLGITPAALKEVLKLNTDIKALVLTYPNYYGIGTDLKCIKKIVDEHNILLLVDEAHGAHLFLSDALMPSAIDIGADIVVHSSHKSLPVMTQSSVLHLNSEHIDQNKLEYMLKLHQTSSPSYVLMSSLDIGYDIAKNNGRELMKELLENINLLKEKQLVFLSQNDLPEGFLLDPTKLSLKGKLADIDPKDFELKLRDKGIQLEFSNDKYAVFVTSIMNQYEDFEYLSKTMEMLKFKCYSGIDNTEMTYKSQQKMTLADAFYANKIAVQLDESIGCISADYITPYPPGIPLIVPGEIIDKYKLEMIIKMLDMNINISGLDNKNDSIQIVFDKEAK